jgi:hypothetical protein
MCWFSRPQQVYLQSLNTDANAIAVEDLNQDNEE